MKQFTFTSSAIDNLSMEGDRVSVTFHGGREYTYKAVDPITFETALNGEIADPEGSVGRLVNQLIRSEDLVTVWQVAQGGVLSLPPPFRVSKSIRNRSMTYNFEYDQQMEEFSMFDFAEEIHDTTLVNDEWTSYYEYDDQSWEELGGVNAEED